MSSKTRSHDLRYVKSGINSISVEQWKTHFYKVEGWDPQTGYPKRKTLEDLGMKKVAGVLQDNNKLG